MSPRLFGIHALLRSLLTQRGAGFPPDALVPQNTGSVPLVAMGGGVSPPVVPLPMGDDVLLHMGGSVEAPIPGVAPPCIPLGGMVLPHTPFLQVSVPIDVALLPHAPLPSVSSVPPPAPLLAIIRMAELFKLPTMKDAKAHPTLHELPGLLDSMGGRGPHHQFPEFRSWLLLGGPNPCAVQDGSLCFLFENKVSQYDGKGFEMLAALNQHCQPNSIANAFTTLIALFNDSMTNSKEIMAFCLRFDGMVNNMAPCKITIPPILLVMFFLWAMHPRYKDLLEQFSSQYKSLESASLDSKVSWFR
jgi:hypothetical protein